VRFGDDLEISVDGARVGKTSATFLYEGRVRGQSEVAVRGKIVVACLDMKAHKAMEVPAKYRAMFEKHLRIQE
jgi:acyl-CoA thioesterase FadM